MITPRRILLFFRLSRPHLLIGGVLLYGLGGAIARYLGRPVDPGLYLQGQIIVIAVQLMGQYLNEYFDPHSKEEEIPQRLFGGKSGALGKERLPRRAALYAAIVALALAAMVASNILVRGEAGPLAWMLLILGFLGAFFYSVPPIRLIESGYGEITTAVVFAGIVPAFAFSLQTGVLHRLLIMSSAPLIALHFAMMISLSLPSFGTDSLLERKNLTVRIGWSAAMRLHDMAILFAAGSLAFAFLYGMPQRVALGTLIALPLALAQIWQHFRIRRGFPPNWPTLTFSAVGLFVLTAYLEVVGYLLS